VLPAGGEIFLFSTAYTGHADNAASYAVVPGTLSSEVKLTEHEADLSLPSSAEVNIPWS
jgi:hypothetical protein